MAGDTLELGSMSSLALQSLSVEYFGHPYAPPTNLPRHTEPLSPLWVTDIERPCSAHAGYAPWECVNALDAVSVTYAGISALCQQIRPEQRVHGVISGCDWVPNSTFSFPSPPPLPIPFTSLWHAPLFPTGKKGELGRGNKGEQEDDNDGETYAV